MSKRDAVLVAAVLSASDNKQVVMKKLLGETLPILTEHVELLRWKLPASSTVGIEKSLQLMSDINACISS